MVKDESLYTTNLTVRDLTMYINDDVTVRIYLNDSGIVTLEYEGRWEHARETFGHHRLTGIESDVIDKYNGLINVWTPVSVLEIYAAKETPCK